MSAPQDDWLFCAATQSKIQVKIPLSAYVDDVSSVECDVGLLAVIAKAVVTVTVVVIGSSV